MILAQSFLFDQPSVCVVDHADQSFDDFVISPVKLTRFLFANVFAIYRKL